MRGTLKSMPFYRIRYPSRAGGPEEYSIVDASYFVEDREKFRRKIRELERTSAYDEATRFYRSKAIVLHTAEQDYSRIEKGTACAELKELARCKRDFATLSLKLGEVHREFEGKILEAEMAVLKAENRAAEAEKKYGTSSAEHRFAQEVFNESKNMLRLERRRYHGKVSRITKRINSAEVIISAGARFRAIITEAQAEKVQACRKEVDDAKKRIERVMEQVVGEEVYTPGRILFLIKEDPDISDETMQAVLSLTPNYKRTDWNISKPQAWGGVSMALIASCINDDPGQSMADLIVRLASFRGCCFTDAMVVLQRMRKSGMLYRPLYMPDGTIMYEKWLPTAHRAPVADEDYDNENWTAQEAACIL